MQGRGPCKFARAHVGLDNLWLDGPFRASGRYIGRSSSPKGLPRSSSLGDYILDESNILAGSVHYSERDKSKVKQLL